MTFPLEQVSCAAVCPAIVSGSAGTRCVAQASEISRFASDGLSGEIAFKLRPRERAPLDVVATVGADPTGLRWVLRPAAPSDQTRH